MEKIKTEDGLNLKFIKEKPKKIPVVKEIDVIVAGGGVAGIAAAVSAARNGAKTILVEQYGFLGGTATVVPVNWFGGYNSEVHGGFTKEIIERLKSANGLGRQFFLPTVNGYMVEFSVDVFKRVSLQMLEEVDAKLLLHAWISEPIVEDGKIKGIIIESKSGREAILGNVIVDATGDGDIAARAEVPFQKGREIDGKTQAMTMVGPVLEGVDTEKLWKFLEEYKKEHPEEISEFNDNFPSFVAGGFSNLLKKARKKGDIHMEYDTIWINGKLGTDIAEIGGSFVPNVDGTNVFDLTYAEIESIKQLSSLVSFARKYIPGFESCYYRMDSRSFAVGVRETRRIIGEYVLTEKDILNGKKFDDAIARNSTPMDVHSPEGHQSWTKVKPYDIPYRCLVPKKVDNLLVAGRCISVTHKALASVRFIPCCMATGQATGGAAALAVKDRVNLVKLDVIKLQQLLKSQGVII